LQQDTTASNNCWQKWSNPDERGQARRSMGRSMVAVIAGE
jgi:hypothetical protein